MSFKVNYYFDNKVSLIGFEFVNGFCILGVMLLGEYIFFIL